MVQLVPLFVSGRELCMRLSVCSERPSEAPTTYRRALYLVPESLSKRAKDRENDFINRFPLSRSKTERFLTPSSTRPCHRVKRWYLRRCLTPVTFRVKQIPEVFRNAHGALFQMGCLVYSINPYPLKLCPLKIQGQKGRNVGTCRC